MQTIDLLPGTDIERAATLLSAMAPACADFNGIRIRARYATTKPRDIVARYWRLTEERSVIWRNSPQGKAAAAERAHRAPSSRMRSMPRAHRQGRRGGAGAADPAARVDREVRRVRDLAEGRKVRRRDVCVRFVDGSRSFPLEHNTARHIAEADPRRAVVRVTRICKAVP